MGRISENPVSAWKEKTDWFMNSSQCRELDRIDGAPMEFEWNVFPGFTTLQILAEIQNIRLKLSVNLSNSKDGSSSCQCTTTLLERRRKRRIVYCEFPNRSKLCEKIRALTLVVSSAWIRKEMVRNSDGKWDRVAEDMMLNFSERGHPVFRGSSGVERGALRSKGKGKLSFHFCGDDNTTELVLRTIVSVKQLSIYGAVADMCDGLACRISGCSERTGELVALDNPETMVIPTECRTNHVGPMTMCKEICCNCTSKNSQIFLIIFNGSTCEGRGESISRASTLRNWTN